MKKIVAIVCALLIAWPVAIKVYVIATWQLNRDYIAQNLCENRNDAASTCEGHCQLVKQLGETEQENKPFLPFAGLEKLNLSVFYITDANKTFFQNQFCKSPLHSEGQAPRVEDGISLSVFHPPEV